MHLPGEWVTEISLLHLGVLAQYKYSVVSIMTGKYDPGVLILHVAFV